MKTLLAIASVGEALTGLLLLAMPANVIKLLFGAPIAGAGIVMSRVAGIALIALGFACWPSRDAPSSAARGMIGYSLLMTIYLFVLGVGGTMAGILLWPAAVLHAGLTLLLALLWQVSHKQLTAVVETFDNNKPGETQDRKH